MVNVIGESTHPDDEKEGLSYHLLAFRMAEDPDNNRGLSPAIWAQSTSSTYQNSGPVNGHYDMLDYVVYQDAVDSLARVVKWRMAEAGPDSDAGTNGDDGTDDDETEEEAEDDDGDTDSEDVAGD
ncbi:hypothetical protein QFC24_002905 [Naganishia onofrii]|uniref:Uncharacterized protein n=1 Tax=Naganishia onofrii TaxID=1851511 RepID=A0ACC2XLV4_9TREE|nr:hypothetical protein QFC24_002905 [Naganishia onofrii]